MKNYKRRGFLYGFNITATILILLFIGTFTLLHAFERSAQSVDLEIVPEVASTFGEYPTSFVVNVRNASNTPLNAIEFEIHYDPQALLVTDVIPHATLCEERFIITKTIDPTTGIILFQCGTITPFSGTQGVVATITTLPLTLTTPSLRFGTTTHVLAHDGFGTDVTRNRYDLSFSQIEI